MIYTIKMMSGDHFEIGQETFKKLAGQTGLVHFKEIDCILNLNSVVSITPKEMVETDRKQLHDGTIAFKKFGVWYNERNPEARIDLNHYPELREWKKITDDNLKNGDFIKLPSNGLEPVVFKPSRS